MFLQILYKLFGFFSSPYLTFLNKYEIIVHKAEFEIWKNHYGKFSVIVKNKNNNLQIS